jgi:hypothetical protein
MQHSLAQIYPIVPLLLPISKHVRVKERLSRCRWEELLALWDLEVIPRQRPLRRLFGICSSAVLRTPGLLETQYLTGMSRVCKTILSSIHPNIAHSVDLDIEGGGSSGYAAFLTKLRSLASGLNKK